MTLESLARTIAKARHGTDAMWANYMGAAEAAAEWSAGVARSEMMDADDREAGQWNAACEAIAEAFLATPTDDIPVFLERP
ncbi:hypothetical protein [Mesorhizobium sp. B2-2-1]|uniref:hypothetical protein n=1 Tax=Mesorhizobium sp. B2-2-1 TaxID=2589965 RepID=UPI00112DF205|nr:hypothetical protein [Mesorhizobium sp. B2-2-1]TPM67430.1 hypothetical protein FJ965_09845 [Mesorhizobium sp. B2-2-1]